MKNIIFSLCCFLISINCFSQNNKEKNSSIKKNTIYFELGGLSLNPFSLNYDRVLFNTENVYFTRTIGFGFNPHFEEKYGFSIPLAFNLTTGYNKKNHFELGLGLTYSEFNTDINEEKIIYGGLKLGYKYQSKSPIFFKVGVNIFYRVYVIKDNKISSFEDLNLIENLAYLTLGYTFKTKNPFRKFLNGFFYKLLNFLFFKKLCSITYFITINFNEIQST